MLKNMRHAGIVVSDLDRSLSFYCDVLGFKIEKDMWESGEYIDNFSGLRDLKVRTVKMSIPSGDMIELLWFGSHRPGSIEKPCMTDVGCSHVAFTVQDLDALYRELCAKGVVFNCPPQIPPDGGAKATFCRDPDGTLIELVEELG
jgi:catechol 2,3-dioxygenase-like lactoylglutathione lyase family enzyme